MDGKIWRVVLVVCLTVLLLGFCPSRPALASSGGSWTDIPPKLDGRATNAEWANRPEIIYSHFRIRYMNDDQFLYILIDVTGETAAAGIGDNENFNMYVDANSDGTSELVYYMDSSGSNPLFHSHYISGLLWTIGSESISYARESFDNSPSSSMFHRFYEVALRLREMNVLPGHSFKTNFYIASQHPVFTETTTQSSLDLSPVQVVYVYSSPTGLANATAYHDMLLQTAGLLVNYVSLEQAAAADYSSFRTIIIGDETGTSAFVDAWSGSAAALEKIHASKKPVVGLGLGGMAFFGELGLYSQHINTWEGSNGQSVHREATDHAAWNTPTSVSSTSPVSLYSTPVYYYAVYSGGVDFPWRKIVRLGRDSTDSTNTHFSVLAESANNTCYSLWGFRGSPAQLTTDGKRLLSNLIWQPACRPSVIFLVGSPIDTTMRDGILDLLVNNGIPVNYATATNTPTIDPANYDRILVSWDTDAAWVDPVNRTTVLNSGLPVIGLGGSGAFLLQRLGVPMANATGLPVDSQIQAAMVNPFQSALRRPYEVAVPAGLRMTLDSSPGGVRMYAANGSSLFSETVIGTRIAYPHTRPIATQPLKGVCYALYGFQSYPSNMTIGAKNILLNLLIQPACNNAVALPILIK